MQLQNKLLIALALVASGRGLYFDDHGWLWSGCVKGVFWGRFLNPSEVCVQHEALI